MAIRQNAGRWCKRIAKEMGIGEYFEFIGVPCSPNFITKDKTGEASLEYRTLFVQEMIKQGVLMPWVAISYSHGDEEINITLEAIKHSLLIYRKALEDGVDKYLEGRPINLYLGSGIRVRTLSNEVNQVNNYLSRFSLDNKTHRYGSMWSVGPGNM